MNITKEQQESFKEAAKPMIKWINENCHPHVVVNVDCNSAELLEMQTTIHCDDYIKD